MEKQECHTLSLWKQVEADREDEPEEQDQVSQAQVSRWSKYLDTTEKGKAEEEEEEENVLMDRQQLHGNIMIDRKRKRREGWTDEGGHESWTPEKSYWSSLMMKPVRPSATTISLNHTTPPIVKHTSSSSKKSIKPPSQSTGPASRWAHFLSSDSQVEKGERPSVSGWSQLVGGAAPLSCNDIIGETLLLTQPRPLLPVSSMFESGEDFNFDE